MRLYKNAAMYGASTTYTTTWTMILTVKAESEDTYTLCSYCHRMRPCSGPNNICTECTNQMIVSAESRGIILDFPL
jgi:hypothetical protein